MSTRKGITFGIAAAALAAGALLTGCGADGAGKPVTPENSIVAQPPQRRGAAETTTAGPGQPMPPGAPGAVGPGAPGGAGGR